MTLSEQIRERERMWQRYHALGPEPPAPERDAQAVLADLSFLLRQVPVEERQRDPDPEKRGIAQMRAAFLLLSSK